MHLETYLFFDGRCEEAFAFYRDTLGAESLGLMHFKDMPGPGMSPQQTPNKVMHMSFRIGDTVILASDGRCTGTPNFQGFALSLSVADEAEANRLFAALGEGGEVRMAMSKTFFAPAFGMVADRFGVSWMIIVRA